MVRCAFAGTLLIKEIKCKKLTKAVTKEEEVCLHTHIQIACLYTYEIQRKSHVPGTRRRSASSRSAPSRRTGRKQEEKVRQLIKIKKKEKECSLGATKNECIN